VFIANAANNLAAHGSTWADDTTENRSENEAKMKDLFVCLHVGMGVCRQRVCNYNGNAWQQHSRQLRTMAR
jgi:hypothetical protein